jgi:hypothetical protein
MRVEESGSSETAVATRLHGAISQDIVTDTYYVPEHIKVYLLSTEHFYLLMHGSYKSQNLMTPSVAETAYRRCQINKSVWSSGRMMMSGEGGGQPCPSAIPSNTYHTYCGLGLNL